jgi:E3 ubiquitin-protein ligase BRE1
MSHAEALGKLSEVSERLKKFQRVYGDISTTPPDVAGLAHQLESKDAEIQKLVLLDSQREQVGDRDYSL